MGRNPAENKSNAEFSFVIEPGTKPIPHILSLDKNDPLIRQESVGWFRASLRALAKPVKWHL